MKHAAAGRFSRFVWNTVSLGRRSRRWCHPLNLLSTVVLRNDYINYPRYFSSIEILLVICQASGMWLPSMREPWLRVGSITAKMRCGCDSSGVKTLKIIFKTGLTASEPSLPRTVQFVVATKIMNYFIWWLAILSLIYSFPTKVAHQYLWWIALDSWKLNPWTIVAMVLQIR